MRFPTATCGLIALAMSLCLGCADNNPWNRQEIRGTVTFNGKPCARGTITLMPLSNDNTMAGGAIQDGAFAIVAKKGLAPGDYGVSLSIPDPRWTSASRGEPAEVAPPEWQKGTGHTITVTDGGPNRFEFAVENPNFEKKPAEVKN